MKKIPLSQQGKHAGKYFALVDDEDFEKLNKHKWFFRKLGRNNIYAITRISGEKQKEIFMHRLLLKCPSNLFGDHIDGNGLNNQKGNLRIATKQNNQANSRIPKNNTSGYKGVRFRPDRNKFVARISFNDNTKHLGYFDTDIEAAKAYNQKALELFGEFANLNKIPGENAN